MTVGQEDDAARRTRIAGAVKHTDENVSAGRHLREFLEAPLREPLNGDPFPVLEPGSSTPIVVVKRDFYSPEDGKRHHGLFDPAGHQSDLPFKTSEWAE